MNRSDSIVNLAAALVKAQAAMGNAIKGSSNPFFKSSYANLNAVREAALPALNANGITMLQPTVAFADKNYVETILLHESGEYISGFTEIKVSKANDAQAEGSGISYARRYGAASLINLGSEDDDGEKSVGRTHSNAKGFTPAAVSTSTASTNGGSSSNSTLPTPPIQISTATPTKVGSVPVTSVNSGVLGTVAEEPKKKTTFNQAAKAKASAPTATDDGWN